MPSWNQTLVAILEPDAYQYLGDIGNQEGFEEKAVREKAICSWVGECVRVVSEVLVHDHWFLLIQANENADHHGRSVWCSKQFTSCRPGSKKERKGPGSNITHNELTSFHEAPPLLKTILLHFFIIYFIWCGERERPSCTVVQMWGCKSLFSPSTTWAPKIKLRSSSFAKKCIYPLSHVASPMPCLLKVPFHPNSPIGWDNMFNTWTLGEHLRVKP